MIPFILPIRLMACVFDPARQSQTGIATGPGATGHDWSFRAPDYERAEKTMSAVWDKLCEPVPPPVAKPAIFLSWSLPDGWGRPLRADDPASLPRLPDRWLVVRLRRRTHRDGQWADIAPAVKAWVVDAGVSGGDGSAPVVLGSGPGRVGVVRDLKTALAAPADEPREALTAHGAARSQDVTFTSFMPSNLNNMSCMDVLDDVPRDEFADSAYSYFVTGWYREPDRHDPLRLLRDRPPAEIRAALSQPEPEGPAAKAAIPGERCLFQGILAHVDYFNPASHLGPAFGAPNPSRTLAAHPCKIQRVPRRTMVGIGATVEEAMAALLTISESGVPEADRKAMAELLDALFSDTIGQWGEADAAPSREHARRRTGFTMIPGGRSWRVKPAETTAGTNPKPPKLSADHVTRLQALNKAQAAADALAMTIAAEAETLHAATWLMQAKTRADDESKPLERYLKDKNTAAATLWTSYATALGRIKTDHDCLRDALAPLKLDLVAEDEPPFHLPKEPAVALLDTGARFAPRPLRARGRTSDQIATTVKKGEVTPLASPAPVAESIAGAFGDGDLTEALARLAKEAALVEATVAALIRNAQGAPTFGTAATRSQKSWMDKAETVFRHMGGAAIWPGEPDKAPKADDGTVVCLTGQKGMTLPLADLCTVWTQQPWLPLFLDWQSKWLNGTAPEAVYRGRTLLSHRPTNILRNRLLRFGTPPKAHDGALTRLLNHPTLARILDWDVVGQYLSGFHQQYLGRDDGLPRLTTAAGTAPGLSPQVVNATLAPPSPPSSCGWFRTGTLGIEQLRIIDIFGQALVLGHPTLAVCDGPPTARISPPPRVLEPLRLKTRFAGSVCGWMLPGRIDRTVVIYDGAGIPKGILSPAGTEARFRALKPPAGTAGTGLADDLRLVVESLRQPGALAAFLERGHRALAATPRLGGGASAASLIGRPLALVRAEIAFERRGGPILDPNWLANDRSAAALGRDEAAFIAATRAKAAPVAVTLGCSPQPDDGLVCFWDIQGGKAALGWSGKAVSETAGDAAISLDLPHAGQPGAKSLLVLLDPFGKLYLDPKVLPVTGFPLPGEWYEDILARLPAVLPMNPVMIGSNADLSRLLAPGGTGRPRIDLPVPLGTRSAPQAGAGAGREAPARVDFAGPQPIEVEPLGAQSPVPDAEIAAVDGILIV